MSQTTELLLKIRQQGGEQLTKLQGSLKNLGQQSSATNVNFKQLAEELKKVQSTSVNSINNLKGYASAWREIANSVKIGSAEFRQASAEAAKLESQLQRTQGRRGGIRALGQVAATAAGAGVFGGIEGAAGALIGGAFGGAPGAIAGGVFGAQVGGFRKQTAVIGETVAQLNRYRIALAGVSVDQKDYERSIASTTEFSRSFLLPLSETTQQYTRLKASVVGAGLSTKETDQVFRGISAAIIATGGNAEQLNSALTATSQVFSKGKVSAEELRQQIGERLPGAFTIFAQSIGKTPQELDKALEKGEVTLEDFLLFSEELFNRYGQTAEILATAPENAGARLKYALDQAAINYGGFFQLVGALFQDNAAKAVQWLNQNSKVVKQYVTDWINAGYAIYQVLRRIINAFGGFTKRVYEMMQANPGVALANYLGGFMKKAFGGVAGPPRFKPEDLFPEFTPTSFGTGIGDLVPSGLDEGAGDKKTKSKKEIIDRTKEELDLIKQINQLEREGLTIQAAYAEFQLKELEVSLALGRQQIGNNQAIERSEESLTRLYKTVDQAFKGYGSSIIKSMNEQEKAQSEITKLIQDAEISAGITTGEKAKQLLIDRKIAEFTTQYPQATSEQIERLRTALGTTKKELTEIELLGKSVLQTFGEGISNAFMSIFDNAKSIRDVLSDVLKQTAQLLLNFGIQAGLKGLFPKLFAMGGIMTNNGPLPLKRYAGGGIASSPQLALFGEGSRPEAYVPLPDGRTIPVTMKNGNNQATTVTVNVDASGTSAQGNAPNANALGNAIGAAVQAELIKQKRPGGLLA